MKDKTPPGWSHIGDDNDRQPLDSNDLLHLCASIASRPPVLGPMSTASLHSALASLWDSGLKNSLSPRTSHTDETPLKFCKDCKNKFLISWIFPSMFGVSLLAFGAFLVWML